MNPWLIVSWIAALAVAALILALTAAVIIGVIKTARTPNRTTTTSILKGRRHE